MAQSGLFDLPPEVLCALATVLGFAAAGKLTPAQQNTLGNALMLTGQVLETASAQGQYLQAQQVRPERRLADIEARLAELERQNGA
ncbi:MAG: hypothetical protein IK141_05675 [Clostridia bacterium]|nr:hypothetical protein [Clostridia bacterium]